MTRTKIRSRFRALFLAFCIAALIAVPQSVHAQEDGTTETFEDASLPGWEHSQNVRVSEGTLRIDPDNVAFKMGTWGSPSISLQIRPVPPGGTIIHYHASEQGAYHLHLLYEGETAELFLEKELEGTPTELGGAVLSSFKENDWNSIEISLENGIHSIAFNENEVINAEDSDVLPAGGIGLMVYGEETVQFDNLSIDALEGGAAENIGEGPPPEDAPAEQEPLMEEERLEEGPVPEQPMPGGEELAPASIQTTPQVTPQPGTGTRSLLEEFLISGTNPIDLRTYVINLALAALMSFILSRVYIYWGASLSNRRKFSANFMLLTLTTTFIILVVRSSVALSLGLVGALSIVRFRAAIKEPEELAYLFLAIGLGIGLGDNQRLITLLAFTASIAVLGLMNLLRHSKADINLHLTISSTSHKPDLKEVLKTLQPFCSKSKLIRFEEHDELYELSFIVELVGIEDLSSARNALVELLPGAGITFLDNKGIW